MPASIRPSAFSFLDFASASESALTARCPSLSLSFCRPCLNACRVSWGVEREGQWNAESVAKASMGIRRRGRGRNLMLSCSSPGGSCIFCNYPAFSQDHQDTECFLVDEIALVPWLRGIEIFMLRTYANTFIAFFSRSWSCKKNGHYLNGEGGSQEGSEEGRKEGRRGLRP